MSDSTLRKLRKGQLPRGRGYRSPSEREENKGIEIEIDRDREITRKVKASDIAPYKAPERAALKKDIHSAGDFENPDGYTEHRADERTTEEKAESVERKFIASLTPKQLLREMKKINASSLPKEEKRELFNKYKLATLKAQGDEAERINMLHKLKK